MNEIRFTISKIPENNRDALIQHIRNSVHDYDAQLQYLNRFSGLPPEKVILSFTIPNAVLLKQMDAA